MTHVLVVANERSPARASSRRSSGAAKEGPVRITVICPVSSPRSGYVVYEDTRRAAARRRLDRTVELLREHGIAADGFVVDADPVDVVRDAFGQLVPPPDAVVVSTHPRRARAGCGETSSSASGPPSTSPSSTSSWISQRRTAQRTCSSSRTRRSSTSRCSTPSAARLALAGQLPHRHSTERARRVG